MGVSGALQTYRNVLEYGMRKARLRFDRLLLQSFMAGVFIGMAGNACISFAGGFRTDANDPHAISPVMQKFIFASIFPVAFIAIITTGAELFTGNTMTMLICLFERRVTVLQLLRNWLGSFLGNWMGTLFSAYFLTYLCSHFDQHPYIDYLNAIAEHKTSHGWGSCFLRGIGCNTWVCLAVWFVLACDDWSGKVLALWFPIVCFVLSSYEHIIANLYTLQLCAMFRVRTSLSTIILSNLVPTFLGNLVGGCGLVGAVYYYIFYPGIREDGMEGGSHFELACDSSRHSKDRALRKTFDDGKKGDYTGAAAGASLTHETSGFLLKEGIPVLRLPDGRAGGGGGYGAAGAATAGEFSERSTNNFANEKENIGATASRRDTCPTGNSGSTGYGKREGGRLCDNGCMSVCREESDLEKGRDAVVDAGGSSSAETWGGESSTIAGCGYSNDNTTGTTGGGSSAVLKAAAVHGAAACFADKQCTVVEPGRGYSARYTTHSSPSISREKADNGVTEHIGCTNSSSARSPRLELAVTASRRRSATSLSTDTDGRKCIRREP